MSGDFPVENPIQGHAGENDVFLTKLNSLDGNLEYSTFLGGSQVDFSSYNMGIGASGCVYLTGCTWSSDFPTRNAFQTAVTINAVDAEAVYGLARAEALLEALAIISAESSMPLTESF